MPTTQSAAAKSVRYVTSYRGEMLRGLGSPLFYTKVSLNLEVVMKCQKCHEEIPAGQEQSSIFPGGPDACCRSCNRKVATAVLLAVFAEKKDEPEEEDQELCTVCRYYHPAGQGCPDCDGSKPEPVFDLNGND